MEATITTIGDIFKKKVEDSVKAPTIWIDRNGEKHEDYDGQIVQVYPSIVMRENGDGFVLKEDQFNFNTGDDTKDAMCLFIDGYVIQLGSHVIEAKYLLNNEVKSGTYDISDVFRYATNLRAAVSCFRALTSLTEIPEDLFWNCPKLEIAVSVFEGTSIDSIPKNLFSKNPLLRNVSCLFEGCHNITAVPSGLFANNPNIKSYRGLFTESGISEVPFELFDNIRGANVIPEFNYIFRKCNNLKSLPDGFFRDFPKGSNFNQSIEDARLLKSFEIYGGGNTWLDYEKIQKAYYPDWTDLEDMENATGRY